MKKSIKSELIKIIANDYCIQSMWTNANEIEKPLQNELNNYLSFDVKVFNAKTNIDGSFSTNILFEDEYNKNRVINVAIENVKNG